MAGPENTTTNAMADPRENGASSSDVELSWLKFEKAAVTLKFERELNSFVEQSVDAFFTLQNATSTVLR